MFRETFTDCLKSPMGTLRCQARCTAQNTLHGNVLHVHAKKKVICTKCIQLNGNVHNTLQCKGHACRRSSATAGWRVDALQRKHSPGFVHGLLPRWLVVVCDARPVTCKCKVHNKQMG